jgi:hypothetical protein
MLATASSRIFWLEVIRAAISCSTVLASTAGASLTASTGAATGAAAGAALAFLGFSSLAAATGAGAGTGAAVEAAGASVFLVTRLAPVAGVVLLIVLLPVEVFDIFKRTGILNVFTGVKFYG